MNIASTLRTGLFWTGSATFVLIGAAAALYGPSLPAFSRLYGVSPAEAGLLISAHNLGGLAGLSLSAFLGALSARQSLAIMAAGSGLIAASLGWWPTLLGALLLGAGYGLVSAVLNRRFLTESGENGPAMVGLLNAIFGIGAIAGPLLLLAAAGRPALAFGAVTVALVCLIPAAGGPPGAAPPAGGLNGFLRRPGILILGAAAVGFEVSLVGLGPTALVGRGLAEARATELASLFFTFFLAARFSLVWLAPRFAPRMLLAAGFLGGAVFATAAALLPPGAFFALAGASVGLLFPSYFVAASAVLGTDGRAAAAILAAGYIGAVLVPALASGLIGLAGPAVLFPAAAVFALAVGLVTALGGRAG